MTNKIFAALLIFTALLGLGQAQTKGTTTPSFLQFDNAGLTEFDASQLTGYNLSLVKNLSLARNLATVLRADTFVKFVNLEVLNLSGNKLTKFEKGWSNGLRNLVTLDLSNNRLDSLETGTFYGLVKLKNLNLNSNGFTFKNSDNLPFLGLVSLANLSLSFNNFQGSISAFSFASLFSIKSLSLAQSNIRLLDFATFPNGFGFCDLGINPISTAGNTVINVAGNPILSSEANKFVNSKCYSFILS